MELILGVLKEYKWPVRGKRGGGRGRQVEFVEFTKPAALGRAGTPLPIAEVIAIVEEECFDLFADTAQFICVPSEPCNSNGTSFFGLYPTPR